MVAGEERLLFFQRIADVIGGVAGRVHAFHGEARAADDIAVAHRDVGHEIRVPALFHRDALLVWASAVRTEAISGRARPFLKRAGRGRMIAMGMRDEDMGHVLALQSGAQIGEMFGIVGTRIDHCNLAFADNRDAGAFEGERAGIGCEQAPDRGLTRTTWP